MVLIVSQKIFERRRRGEKARWAFRAGGSLLRRRRGARWGIARGSVAGGRGNGESHVWGAGERQSAPRRRVASGGVAYTRRWTLSSSFRWFLVHGSWHSFRYAVRRQGEIQKLERRLRCAEKFALPTEKFRSCTAWESRMRGPATLKGI